MKNIHKMMLANNYWNPITGTSFNAGLGYKPYRMKGGLILGDDGIWREEDNDPDLIGFTVNPVTGYFKRNERVDDEFEEQLPNRIYKDDEEELANIVNRNKTNVNTNIIVKNPKLHKHNEPPEPLIQLEPEILNDPDIDISPADYFTHMSLTDIDNRKFWAEMLWQFETERDEISSDVDFTYIRDIADDGINIGEDVVKDEITIAAMPVLTDTDKNEIKKYYKEKNIVRFNKQRIDDLNDTQFAASMNLHLPKHKLVEYKMVGNSKHGLTKMGMSEAEADTDEMLQNYIGETLGIQLNDYQYLPFDDITSPINDPSSGSFDDFKLYYEYDLPFIKAKYEEMYNTVRSTAISDLEIATEEMDENPEEYIKAKYIVDNFYLYFNTTQDYQYVPVTVTKFNYSKNGIKTKITPTETTVTIKPEAIRGGGALTEIKRANASFRYITPQGVFGLNLNKDRGLVKNKVGNYVPIYKEISNPKMFDGKKQYKWPPTDLVFLHKHIVP